MPRQARIVIPNTAHHITQRGNYRQDVFDNTNNYKKYCELINEYTQENDPEMAEDIRIKTNRGLIVGTDKFVNKLEELLNRSLQCLNQGRPRKEG